MSSVLVPMSGSTGDGTCLLHNLGKRARFQFIYYTERNERKSSVDHLRGRDSDVDGVSRGDTVPSMDVIDGGGDRDSMGYGSGQPGNSGGLDPRHQRAPDDAGSCTPAVGLL